MRQITVLSGKGGTGKTSLTASFAVLAKNVVVADCDVDAPDLHLLLHPQILETQKFKGAKTSRSRPKKMRPMWFMPKTMQIQSHN